MCVQPFLGSLACDFSALCWSLAWRARREAPQARLGCGGGGGAAERRGGIRRANSGHIYGRNLIQRKSGCRRRFARSVRAPGGQACAHVFSPSLKCILVCVLCVFTQFILISDEPAAGQSLKPTGQWTRVCMMHMGWHVHAYACTEWHGKTGTLKFRLKFPYEFHERFPRMRGARVDPKGCPSMRLSWAGDLGG